jgi:uncharacterized membrane protein
MKILQVFGLAIAAVSALFSGYYLIGIGLLAAAIGSIAD